MKTITKALQRALKQLGLEVKRSEYINNLERRSEEYDRIGELVYQSMAELCLKARGELHIAVVGANDGKTNDPIYEFAKEKSDSTHITLIEPLRPLISICEKNYRGHQDAKVICSCIGPIGELVLYYIKKEYWPEFQPSYANDWPLYRAPLGITSTNKGHLITNLKTHTPLLNPDDAIGEQLVPSDTLLSVLRANERPQKVDILQVDTEGYDDQALYSCNLEDVQPVLIHYEHMHLQEDRRRRLETYLERQRYRLIHLTSNTLCIRE